MLRLIKQWLRAPVETTDGDGRKRMAGGKASRQAFRKAASSSADRQPLHEPVLEILAPDRQSEAWKAHVITYADDFVILSRGHAEEALA